MKNRFRYTPLDHSDEKSSQETGYFLVGKTSDCFLCNLLYDLWPLGVSENTDSYNISPQAVLAHKRLTNMKFNFIFMIAKCETTKQI